MSRMCSSKSSGRSCFVFGRAMPCILPGGPRRCAGGTPVRPLRRVRSGPGGAPGTRRTVDLRLVTGTEDPVENQAPAAPRHWEADVLLRDGRTAHIRPIEARDAELLVDFYARV